MSVFDQLSAEVIRALLPAAYRSSDINVFSAVDSTNLVAKALAREGATHGTLVVSDEQTAGRGRMGRSFYSPRGSGLYMSIVLRPGSCDIQLLTVCAAVAVSAAIEKLTGLSPGIKWVNDLYYQGRKICGILAEAVTGTDSGKIESIVLGIGVNCSTAVFPEELRKKAGSLGRPVSRNALAAEILHTLLDMAEAPEDRRMIEEYRRRSILTGRSVTYEKNGVEIEATALNVNDNGSLLVRRQDGMIESLSYGEVSVRGDLS